MYNVLLYVLIVTTKLWGFVEVYSNLKRTREYVSEAFKIFFRMGSSLSRYFAKWRFAFFLKFDSWWTEYLMKGYLLDFILWFIILNNRLRLVLERFQPFHNRFLIIVHTSTRFCSRQKPLLHCFRWTFEVQHKLATCNLYFRKKETEHKSR